MCMCSAWSFHKFLLPYYVLFPYFLLSCSFCVLPQLLCHLPLLGGPPPISTTMVTITTTTTIIHTHSIPSKTIHWLIDHQTIPPTCPAWTTPRLPSTWRRSTAAHTNLTYRYTPPMLHFYCLWLYLHAYCCIFMLTTLSCFHISWLNLSYLFCVAGQGVTMSTSHIKELVCVWSSVSLRV